MFTAFLAGRRNGLDPDLKHRGGVARRHHLMVDRDRAGGTLGGQMINAGWSFI
jgi:hypothetical protein